MKIRASKENARKAINAMKYVRLRAARLHEDPARLSASHSKQLNTSLALIDDFLEAAHAKLPTEEAFFRDAKRKTKKRKAS